MVNRARTAIRAGALYKATILLERARELDPESAEIRSLLSDLSDSEESSFSSGKVLIGLASAIVVIVVVALLASGNGDSKANRLGSPPSLSPPTSTTARNRNVPVKKTKEELRILTKEKPKTETRRGKIDWNFGSTGSLYWGMSFAARPAIRGRYLPATQSGIHLFGSDKAGLIYELAINRKEAYYPVSGVGVQEFSLLNKIPIMNAYWLFTAPFDWDESQRSWMIPMVNQQPERVEREFRNQESLFDRVVNSSKLRSIVCSVCRSEYERKQLLHTPIELLSDVPNWVDSITSCTNLRPSHEVLIDSCSFQVVKDGNLSPVFMFCELYSWNDGRTTIEYFIGSVGYKNYRFERVIVRDSKSHSPYSIDGGRHRNGILDSSEFSSLRRLLQDYGKSLTYGLVRNEIGPPLEGNGLQMKWTGRTDLAYAVFLGPMFVFVLLEFEDDSRLSNTTIRTIPYFLDNEWTFK